jgi:hypothetical protein
MNNPKIEISIELLHLFSSMKGRKTDKGKWKPKNRMNDTELDPGLWKMKSLKMKVFDQKAKLEYRL